MAIPIPSNLTINTVVDFHRNDLIAPPSAPAVVESLTAIDPRVALNMPLPVGNSSAGGPLQDAIQNPSAKQGAMVSLPIEPSAEQAVLLEILTAEQQSSPGINTGQLQADGLLSQSINRMDAASSAALGQLLSDILAVDVPELGQAIKTSANGSGAQSVVVNWPANASTVSQNDPKQAMNVLYQNLQNSGIFAADQLKKILFPSSDDREAKIPSSGELQNEVKTLIEQLSGNSAATQDSVKLLLRGDLLWQGQLLPNIQGRLYREDAWQTNPQDVTQMQKGSKITMEVDLPNLGPFKVIGMQFGESVHVSIEASANSQTVLSNSFGQLLEQLHTQVDPDARASLKDGGVG